MQITAIILAGGKSKRMGTDKALLQLDGISLLERSISLCKKLCDTIIISSNNKAHQKFGFPLVPDEFKNCGPIGGIYSCLKKSESEWNFIISVDSAFVEADFVSYLMAAIEDVDTIVPYGSKGTEPLIALYNKKCLPAFEEKIRTGDYRMQNLITSLNTKKIDAQSWIEKHPDLFRNLNRPEDISNF
ncbi:molybdenum cofactor guanylyltransferase [uncultured Draconibacterium sp.]|uniref:molybdenum cofactor guanylyltransferase n=1 Tax=uncultured Draconibacterium sp. TaxID=1573823 RepID=UPI0032179152